MLLRLVLKLSLLFILLTSSYKVYSIPLSNPNHIAYYGNEFYRNVGYLWKNRKHFTGIKGRYLKNWLFDILTKYHIPKKGHYDIIENYCSSAGCYRHDPIDYRESRWVVFNELYLLNNSNGRYVVDRYCHEKHNVNPNSLPNHTIINVEHTWPQSKFSSNFPKQTQKADLHHLFPVNSRANSERGNLPFAEISKPDYDTMPGCTDSTWGERKVYSEKGYNPYGSGYFEPPNDHKGNVARAMFYFSVRYKIHIDSIQEFFLRRWHELDPVDDLERRNNNIIFSHQNNRNPFVDFPHLIDAIEDF